LRTPNCNVKLEYATPKSALSLSLYACLRLKKTASHNASTDVCIPHSNLSTPTCNIKLDHTTHHTRKHPVSLSLLYVCLKLKNTASPDASAVVCTFSNFEYLIQIEALPLGMLSVSLFMYVLLPIFKPPFGMLNKEHATPARPVSLSLYLCLKIEKASAA
jgi:hypothetical protein